MELIHDPRLANGQRFPAHQGISGHIADRADAPALVETAMRVRYVLIAILAVTVLLPNSGGAQDAEIPDPGL